MRNLTLSEMRQGLIEKKFSSQELVQAFLKEIHLHDSQYNSFITVNDDQALAQAKFFDQLRAQDKNSFLGGVPIAYKDLLCTKGILTTAASKILANFIPSYQASVVEKLNTAGAISLGKTNLDEFAMGSTNENSYFGAVHNPWDLQAVPGGSSGGSAAAVAARLVPAAIGTDTGGSIRQPAAFCGISGIKPTYGRVSRYGIIAYASSLDQAGPIARDAIDCALLLEAMSGFDPSDSTSIKRPIEPFSQLLNQAVNGMKIGLPKQYFTQELDAEIAQVIDTALQQLQFNGAQLIEIDLPHTQLAIPAYYIIASAEASSNLARYDGVRYGYRCQAPQDLTDLYCRTRAEGFGDEVKRRILVGTHVLSEGFYDAYYRRAQQIRRLIQADFIHAFQQVDVIIGPTTPTTAFTLGSQTDPVSLYLSDIYTVAINLAGLPAMSIPAGFIAQKPVGMQLIGPHFSEARLLALAHQYQQITDWHLRPATTIAAI